MQCLQASSAQPAAEYPRSAVHTRHPDEKGVAARLPGKEFQVCFPGYLFFANEIDRRLHVPWLLASTFEPHPLFEEGDRVRINAAPLAGNEGILFRKRDGPTPVLPGQMLGRPPSTSTCLARPEHLP